MTDRARTIALSLSLGLLLSFPARADQRSEDAAADLLRRKLATEAPGDAEVLAGMSDQDIVVVKGDPSKNIAAAENVEIVFKDGYAYDPAKLLDSIKGMVGIR